MHQVVLFSSRLDITPFFSYRLEPALLNNDWTFEFAGIV